MFASAPISLRYPGSLSVGHVGTAKTLSLLTTPVDAWTVAPFGPGFDSRHLHPATPASCFRARRGRRRFRSYRTTVTVRDANGKDYAVAVKDIEKRAKSLVSIMPEGLVATLSEDELIDLVEYLTQLQTASLTPDSWQIAGPFPAASMEAALARDDKPADWRLVKSATAYFDLAALHGVKSPNSATYARKEFDSPVAQDATILLGTDDGAKLWVNGVEVYTHSQSLAAAPEQHTVKVKLKAGVNTVTLKVANGDSPHGFYFAITSGQELKAK